MQGLVNSQSILQFKVLFPLGHDEICVRKFAIFPVTILIAIFITLSRILTA